MSSILGTVPEDTRRVVPNNITPASHADIPLRDENAPTKSPFVDPGTEHSDANAPHEMDVESTLPSSSVFKYARIPSFSPTLPEIRVPEQSFSPVTSYEFSIPLSVHSSPSPLSLDFTDLRTPPPAGLQHKSSPLVSVVTSSSIKAEPAVVTHAPKTVVKPEMRPDTVYDDEDAYGGI